MSQDELTRLELLAEVDSLIDDVETWADSDKDWPEARHCRTLIRRLAQRADTLRIRLEAPLVVATLGGTGTGKSALVSALVGSPVALSGKERPTTLKPTLICRGDVSPEQLGIDPQSVELVQRDLPALRDLVLIDCPDPDTTEDLSSSGTNLDRLRHLLPHCDVLLITATQQKYRSARVLDELDAASTGARLVFVQTHADIEEDIRDDWRRALEARQYDVGEMFLIDSLAAAEDARREVQPRGDFGRLLDLLTRELTRAAAHRIRRANFLDLVYDTLQTCNTRVEERIPNVVELENAIEDQRAKLAVLLARQMRDELMDCRRQWESRMLDQVTGAWGFSPFSLLLRAYQGLGSLLSGAALLRMRTPAQVALWGAVQGARALRQRQATSRADSAAARAAAVGWSEGDLRSAAVVIEGYATEAGFSSEEPRFAVVSRQASDVGEGFVEKTANELQELIRVSAARHTGWFTRWRYEILLLAVMGVLLFRWGKNFFHDSWMADPPAEIYGMNFFVAAAFWLLFWCLLLLWSFTSRLRRGLNGQVSQLAEQWARPDVVSGLFADLRKSCDQAQRFHAEGNRLIARVAAAKVRITAPVPRLGQRAG